MLKIRVVKVMLRVTAAAAISLLVAFSASAQTVRYIHTDGLGSVVLTTDKDRNIVERSEYEPYGSLLNRSLTDGPGYTGQLMDAATGLAYMQQRYYDPGIGRLLSVDQVTAYGEGQKYFNRYWYAAGNPYRYTDPDGRRIVVEGSKDFKKEIKTQIKSLRATQTGKRIVKALEKSSRTFTIKENAGSSHADPANEADAQNGNGSGGTIAHDPNWMPMVNTTTGLAPTPSSVVLGHELSHAVDYDNGTLDRSINPQTGIRRSEEKAVGIENNIRGEMGLSGERIGH